MSKVLQQLLSAGVHLGHETWKWNPKMKSFIYMEKDNMHIIDLVKTEKHLINAVKILIGRVAAGQRVLFVGTNKSTKRLVETAAKESKSFYVNEKWVGGLLTNWKTFKLSTKKLRLLEKQEKTGYLKKLPKKEMAKKLKEKEKLKKNFDGIKYMKELPGVVIIVGQLTELNALNECNRLKYTRSITLVDTNCDPTIADLVIPANDDSATSVKYLLDHFVLAIKKGKAVLRNRRKELESKIASKYA